MLCVCKRQLVTVTMISAVKNLKKYMLKCSIRKQRLLDRKSLAVFLRVATELTLVGDFQELSHSTDDIAIVIFKKTSSRVIFCHSLTEYGQIVIDSAKFPIS